LQEAAIIEAALANKDRLYRRLHVVVDAASAGALEQSERPVMGCVTRCMPATDSDGIRPPIPTEVGHPFRSKPATLLTPA
jgi:hypothetical protein